MRAKFPEFLAVAVVLASLLAPAAAHADASKPWTLRNMYKIPVEHGVLVYAEDNAEWRVLMDDGVVLADRITFSIELADGTLVKGIELEDGQSGRARISSPIGDGMAYSVTFPVWKGLKIVHTLRTFQSRPFAFIDIAVENVGSEAVKIAAIRPVIAEKSVMQALSPQARVRHRRIADLGGQPVPAPRGDATMAVIYDPAKPISFGVGLIPQGLSRPVVQFAERDGEWHGDISCHYEPFKLVKPGETLMSDPLWISHGVPEPERVDLYYSWVYSTMVTVPKRPFPARGWYTLAGDKDLDAYVGAAPDWKDAGIDHVLLGAGWEGRPGSMEGAGARFPKNMKQAVGSLLQAGLQPGVTIDPLSAEEGGKGWTGTSADGLAWINPALPEGKQALAQKTGALRGWGATFVVVGPSMIPDDTLAEFGLTRMEAQNLAYAALRDAADPMPVFPASVSSVTDDADQWLDAGSSVARMAVYGMEPGPLQWTMNGSVHVTPELSAAIQFWPGPIEFSGPLSKKAQKDVQDLVQLQRMPGQPMDAQNDAPRTWQVQKYDGEGNLVEEKTVSVSDGAVPPFAPPAKGGSGKRAS